MKLAWLECLPCVVLAWSARHVGLVGVRAMCACFISSTPCASECLSSDLVVANVIANSFHEILTRCNTGNMCSTITDRNAQKFSTITDRNAHMCSTIRVRSWGQEHLHEAKIVLGEQNHGQRFLPFTLAGFVRQLVWSEHGRTHELL